MKLCRSINQPDAVYFFFNRTFHRLQRIFHFLGFMVYFEKFLHLLVYIKDVKIKHPYPAPTRPPPMASLARRPRSSLSAHLRGKTS